MKYDITIQIVNYNTKDYLVKCIETVLDDLKVSDLRYKVIILDNYSNDDLSDLSAKYEDKQVSFQKSEKNLGFGAGHNYLSKKCESEYICIVNPDIEIIEPQTFKSLHKRISNDPEVKIIGPMLHHAGDSPQAYDHGELTGFKAKVANYFGSSYWKYRINPVLVAWVSGAFLMIEREIFEELSGFDEKFFLYKEEEDLCLRTRKLGYKILYDPTIRVKNIGSVVARKSDHINRSSHYFIKKHFGETKRYRLLQLFSSMRHG